MNGLPLLSVVIWLPVVGALLLLLIGNRDGQRDGLVRNVTLAAYTPVFPAKPLQD